MIIRILKFTKNKTSQIAVKTLAFVLFVILSIISIYKKIVFCRIVHHRIGHLATNTEVFLRRLKAGLLSCEKELYIGVSSTPPANHQLLKMYKRILPIIENKYFSAIVNDQIIANSQYCKDLPFNNNEYFEFNELGPVLRFTKEEIEKGERELKKMGVKDGAWFVCFSNRDSAYLNTDRNNKPSNNNLNKWSYHDYRNSEIDNFVKAAEYIADLGGYAIRIGSIVEKPLPQNIHPNIIDYSTKYRTDFMDIYLIANCKFALGSGCGVQSASVVFGTPVAWSSLAAIKVPPFTLKDRFIPRKLWSEKENRLLTFKEIVGSEVFHYMQTQQYQASGLKVLEDDPDDILDLAVEMNEMLNGAYKYTQEDDDLQSKYKSIFKEGDLCFGFPSRIGAKYLKKYRNLLEDIHNIPVR